MTFSEIKSKIKNLGQYRTLEKIKRDGLRVVRNSKTGTYWLIEEEFLRPIIFSLKEIDDYQTNRESLSKRGILCCKERKELRKKKLLKYIIDGERRGYNKGPTCRSRARWYCLAKEWHFAPLIFPAKVGERMPVFLSNNIYEDKKLYGITPKKEEDIKLLAALLNSTLFRLFIEFTCRQLTGAQAIADIDVTVVENALTVDLKKMSISQKERLKESFDKLLQSKSLSISKELGAENPKDVSLDRVKPDRRELDKIVMGEILGLSDKEQLEVYRAVIDLVKSRIEKAKSLGKKKKTKTGIDIDALVDIILEKIGNNTLKRFYKEKILSCKDLVTKKLPELKDKIEIKKGLFGWQLISGKNYIECPSEAEARYLKVWLKVGAKSIKVPKDKKYLEKIINDFENLKSNIDEIIEDYLGSILDPKVKNQILHQLWQKII